MLVIWFSLLRSDTLPTALRRPAIAKVNSYIVESAVIDILENDNGAMRYVQSTLVISKSKGPSETLQDIRTSTYQICRIEENTN